MQINNIKSKYCDTLLKKNEFLKLQQVANQLWTTLYDYPCLKKCEGLMKYIRTCVNLAWGLSNLVGHSSM